MSTTAALPRRRSTKSARYSVGNNLSSDRTRLAPALNPAWPSLLALSRVLLFTFSCASGLSELPRYKFALGHGSASTHATPERRPCRSFCLSDTQPDGARCACQDKPFLEAVSFGPEWSYCRLAVVEPCDHPFGWEARSNESTLAGASFEAAK